MTHVDGSAKVNAVVLVPAYNASSTIASTLEALQSNADLHKLRAVIILDDGSSDETTKAAKNAWRSPVPLEVWANQHNLGQWPTTNSGLTRLPAEIDWALILHADDIVKPNWISLYLSEIDTCYDDVATICSSYDSWDPETGRIDPGEEYPDRSVVSVAGTQEAVVNTLARGCWWHISGSAIRIQTFRQIGGFEPSLPYSGDWEWLIRCLAKGFSVLYLPRSTMLYRQHVQGVSSNSFRRGLDIEEGLRIYAMYRDKGYLSSAHYRRQLGVAFRHLCRRILVRALRRDIMGAACHARLLTRTLAQYVLPRS